ncbi:33476_t:CDS:2, partial [Gigaspora margarita]
EDNERIIEKFEFDKLDFDELIELAENLSRITACIMDFNGDNNVVDTQLQNYHNNGANSEGASIFIIKMLNKTLSIQSDAKFRF